MPFKISLKAARVNAGLTLSQAAMAMGKGQATLVNWERNGKRVTLGNKKKLARTYAIPAEFIFFGPDDEYKEYRTNFLNEYNSMLKMLSKEEEALEKKRKAADVGVGVLP